MLAKGRKKGNLFFHRGTPILGRAKLLLRPDVLGGAEAPPYRQMDGYEIKCNLHSVFTV